MITEKRKFSQNQTLAIVLIALGVVIVLMNLGTLNWLTTLRFLQLWPVALIALGVDMWTRGRYRLIVILVALLAAAGLYLSGGSLGTTRVTTETIEQGLENASRATVTIATGVSEVRLRGLEDSNNLITGKLDLAPGERPSQRFNKSGTTAVYELRSEWSRNKPVNVQKHIWDLALTTRIPISLSVGGGVGQSTLDLRELQLTDLTVNAGVGDLDISLAPGTYTAKINLGVGEANIHVPENVAARIEVERGLGALKVRGDFEVDEDVYTSPNYATAEHRIDLRVQGGVGTITIQTGF
jgi:hypothetical protein